MAKKYVITFGENEYLTKHELETKEQAIEKYVSLRKLMPNINFKIKKLR